MHKHESSFCWMPDFILPGDEACRQRLDAYFKSHDIAFEPVTCQQDLKEFSELNIPIISYSNEPFMEIDSECSGIAFHEWLGCVVCGVDWYVTSFCEISYNDQDSFCRSSF